MKLKPISANMTELALTDGTLVLFSYETPVACWKDGLFSITDKKWSKTTTYKQVAWSTVSYIATSRLFRQPSERYLDYENHN